MNDGDATQGDNLDPSNVAAETAKLRPGIKLKKPLYDSMGRLLLDAGQKITESVTEILLARDIEHVLLSPEDASSLLAGPLPLRLSPSLTPGRQDLVAPIETIDVSADTAVLLQMTGVPLKDRLRAKSREPYDPEFAERLASQFITSTKFIEEALRQAMQGTVGDASALAAVTQGYIGQMVNDIDQVLGSSVDAADAKQIVQRSLRMALLGMAVGIEMGLDAASTCEVGLCALIQDWGMLCLPERLWNPNEPFSTQDWELYMRHPEFTDELIQRMTSLSPAVKIAASQVHELCDGSGYPRGLKQNRIHVYARILGAVDAYLCLVEARRGRPAIVPHDALACLLHQLPTGRFDAQVVEALLRAQSLFPLGSYVRLSDGCEAQVIRRSAKDYSKPVVQCLRIDAPHPPRATPTPISIVDLSESTLEVVDIVPAPGKREMRLNRSLMYDIVWDGPES